MPETAERQIRTIRTLLQTPTPEKLSEVVRQLESFAAWLTPVRSSLQNGDEPNLEIRNFVATLPRELSNIRTLLEGPATFFEGLGSFLAAKFGCYERTGALKRFEPAGFSKTVIHL